MRLVQELLTSIHPPTHPPTHISAVEKLRATLEETQQKMEALSRNDRDHVDRLVWLASEKRRGSKRRGRGGGVVGPPFIEPPDHWHL